MQQFQRNAMARALGQKTSLRNKQNRVRRFHEKARVQGVQGTVMALKTYIDSLHNVSMTPSHALPTLDELSVFDVDQQWMGKDVPHIIDTYVKWYIPLQYKMVPTYTPRHYRYIGLMYASGVPELTDSLVRRGKLYVPGSSTRFVPLSMWPRIILDEYIRAIDLSPPRPKAAKKKPDVSAEESWLRAIEAGAMPTGDKPPVSALLKVAESIWGHSKDIWPPPGGGRMTKHIQAAKTWYVRPTPNRIPPLREFLRALKHLVYRRDQYNRLRHKKIKLYEQPPRNYSMRKKIPFTPSKGRPPSAKKNPVSPPTSSPAIRNTGGGGGVRVYDSLADFPFTSASLSKLCDRTNQSVTPSYAENWIFHPPVENYAPRGFFRVWDPLDTRRYFVAPKNEGFAVGALLDSKKFANQSIFYVILVCTNAMSHGIGTLLMTAVEKEAKRLGCTRIWLSSLAERTFVYTKWGYHFGPYYKEKQADPLRSLETGKRAASITSFPAPAVRPSLPVISRNGRLTAHVHPQPSKFYVIKGLHDDTVNDGGYLMTKRVV